MHHGCTAMDRRAHRRPRRRRTGGCGLGIPIDAAARSVDAPGDRVVPRASMSGRRRRPQTVRSVELARASWGAALLLDPAAVLERVHHLRADRASLVVARILGARHVVQAALSGLRPSPAVLAVGVWVDGAHATTAIALACVDRARARAALTDAAVAAAWMAAGWRDLGRPASGDPAHDRMRDSLARALLPRLPGGRVLLARARQAR